MSFPDIVTGRRDVDSPWEEQMFTDLYDRDESLRVQPFFLEFSEVTTTSAFPTFVVMKTFELVVPAGAGKLNLAAQFKITGAVLGQFKWRIGAAETTAETVLSTTWVREANTHELDVSALQGTTITLELMGNAFAGDTFHAKDANAPVCFWLGGVTTGLLWKDIPSAERLAYKPITQGLLTKQHDRDEYLRGRWVPTKTTVTGNLGGTQSSFTTVATIPFFVPAYADQIGLRATLNADEDPADPYDFAQARIKTTNSTGDPQSDITISDTDYSLLMTVGSADKDTEVALEIQCRIAGPGTPALYDMHLKALPYAFLTLAAGFPR